MISRFLVPIGARPPAAEEAATKRRRPTTMDERTLVPAMLPVVPLNGESTIPSNLPLESIAARVVVPRDVSREAYGVRDDLSVPLQPTDLDERITVPVGAAPPVMEPMTIPPPADLVEPDIFMTGEVNLTVPDRREDRAVARRQVSLRLVSMYAVLITLIWLQGKLFPYRPLTREEIELSRNRFHDELVLSPGAFEPSKPPANPPPPAPKVRVDPRVLRDVAPPVQPQPAPTPQPERPPKELPSAPTPKTSVPPQDLASAPTPKVEAPKAPLKLETPDAPAPQRGLILPKTYSPGQGIQDTMKPTPRSSAPVVVGGGRVSGGSRGGGGSGGAAYGGLQMLTPDQGVDFSSYLQRVHDTIERNWFAVMPTSVELGEKGIVVLTFRIMQDGSVPTGDPLIRQNSGKEPLDRAAFSSIRASNPFERLPAKFAGPYIELRCDYYYNILPEYYNAR